MTTGRSLTEVTNVCRSYGITILVVLVYFYKTKQITNCLILNSSRRMRTNRHFGRHYSDHFKAGTELCLLTWRGMRIMQFLSPPTVQWNCNSLFGISLRCSSRSTAAEMKYFENEPGMSLNWYVGWFRFSLSGFRNKELCMLLWVGFRSHYLAKNFSFSWSRYLIWCTGVKMFDRTT
jgi:hypothetical protein